MPDVANTAHDLISQSMAFVRSPDYQDLTIRQMAILGTVCDHGGQKVKNLARDLIISKPVVTRAATMLSGIGLVERIRSESDRRDVMICATPKGHKFRAMVADMAVQS